MGLKSMTGFARAEAECDGAILRWELKSVNGRGLELRLRLPPGFEAVEPELRELASKHLSRGNVHATLSAEQAGGNRGEIVDEDRLKAILSVTDRLVAEGKAGLPRADGLLALRGVLDAADDGQTAGGRPEALLRATKTTFASAVKRLADARAEEGAHLEAVVLGSIDRIEALANAARDERSRNPDIVRQRIVEQAKRLIDQSLDEQRLLQELALIAVKADIGEEIDRLESHVAGARNLVVKNEPVGRRFDFLTQEMNRESNTICSKSNAVALTAIGLDLKVAVDQLREQVQNIE